MIISVASGKGGTGKTLFSVNLFKTIQESNIPVSIVDLDVEEPNSGYFLDYEQIEKTLYMTFPIVDNDKCVSCGACANVCNFNAIVVLPHRVYINKNLCHACYRCKLNCMYDAFNSMEDEIGVLSYSTDNRSDTVEFAKGTLKEGSMHSKDLITQVKDFMKQSVSTNKEHIIIQDCPPGVSCNMTEAVKGSDVVILVTEPTPFGLHDLELAVDTVRKMGLKFFVLINKSDDNDRIIEEYCEKESVNIIDKVPYSEEVCSLYASGRASYSIDWYSNILKNITDKLISNKELKWHEKY